MSLIRHFLVKGMNGSRKNIIYIDLEIDNLFEDNNFVMLKIGWFFLLFIFFIKIVFQLYNFCSNDYFKITVKLK